MEGQRHETCVNHDVHMNRVRTLESSVQSLQAGQHRMEIAVVKMESTLERIEDKIDSVSERVGNMEGTYVAKERVDKLENKLEEHNSSQDEKIGEVKAFIYKVSGVLTFLAALGTFSPFIMRFLGG